MLLLGNIKHFTRVLPRNETRSESSSSKKKICELWRNVSRFEDSLLVILSRPEKVQHPSALTRQQEGI